MSKIRSQVAKQVIPEERALKNTLSQNIKKFRHRRNWSQFTLAAKINLSTNFLADIEAGNTWVSAQTLIKLAQAFEIEAFELLKPQEENLNPNVQHDDSNNKIALSKFSQDLTIVLKESIAKAFDHVKNQYDIE